MRLEINISSTMLSIILSVIKRTNRDFIHKIVPPLYYIARVGIFFHKNLVMHNKNVQETAAFGSLCFLSDFFHSV